ncbi:Tryptophan synthase alpha chain [Anatilimnocola aggregata]|uniref:Tryptophan synthase alpha chain n=1 Tax=Anatilimnocola aggregata TaxID=2528021 RepID=A0A517YBQ2_9BACT|nr:tryptophan synthase subunit alpha [Anatilimnocola aggregata]QDU27665.1 Tryptophan synthase alpha chain [Anatilimnocola aggregata]
MTKIDDLFSQLRTSGKKALMPFVTAGDPDLQFTADVIRELDRRGCTMCEVGIPYSDPIADGPVIQASYTRALAHKIKVQQILAMLGKVSSEVKMPIVTMVSFAIIHRYGPEKFVADAKAAGVCGAIVPDLLVEEADRFSAICKAADFNLIELVTPTTPRERALRIANSSTGFLYYVSIAGITGERTQLPPDLVENVGWLKSQTKLPICIGFGISQPEHVKLLAPVSDGLIVGSAIVRRVAEAATRPRGEVLKEVGEYVSTLLAALA